MYFPIQLSRYEKSVKYLGLMKTPQKLCEFALAIFDTVAERTIALAAPVGGFGRCSQESFV
jgi:hypothetical protein